MPVTHPVKKVFTAADVTVGVNIAASLEDMHTYASINPKTDSWHALDDSDKYAHMMYAWQKLKQVRLCVEDFTWEDADGETRTDVALGEMSAADFARLPADLIAGIGTASAITALEDSKCDSSEMQARDGVLSIKTGDVSTTYRFMKPIEYPLPKTAMMALKPYLCSKTLNIRRTA